MDYIEAFKNLKTNHKWGRKSPHKAVLMLTVIELYEKNILNDNEIRYDETLKSMFLKMWNMVLPNETLFLPDAYLPFWYLQSDNFWHIVPIRGKEDILSLMRDTNIKPSESKIVDSVKYVELDEDLYFLMTLPSGRSSLKRALLETYTNLSQNQIDQFSISNENYVDSSELALSELSNIPPNTKHTNNQPLNSNNINYSDFHCLNEDVQIVMNIEYYSFLKSHRKERDMFREICPSVNDLYNLIVSNPLKQGDIPPTIAYVYENFLSDLRISLMSENDSEDLIESISNAIHTLQGTPNLEKEKTEDEYPSSDMSTVLPSENSDLPHFDSDTNCIITNELENSDSFRIENGDKECAIINSRGTTVFRIDGKFVMLNGIPYRCKIKDICLTIKKMVQEDGTWIIGSKKIVAYSNTDLYKLALKKNFLEAIEEIYDSDTFSLNKIKVNGVWYNYQGCLVSDNSALIVEQKTIPVQTKEPNIPSTNLYRKRKDAILRALGLFRKPAKIKDIVRTISRSAWESVIKEKDVENIIKTMPEVEIIDGKYSIKK